MAWYPDLAPCGYFGTSEPDRLLAVGWLASGRAFPRGQVAPDVLAKIERLAEHAFCIFVFRGAHECELCEPEVIRQRVEPHGAREQWISHLNIFVPYQGRILVAPQCLPHYITAHGYIPPAEFCEAVLRCPEPGEPALELVIREFGGSDFDDEFDRHAECQPATTTEDLVDLFADMQAVINASSTNTGMSSSSHVHTELHPPPAPRDPHAVIATQQPADLKIEFKELKTLAFALYCDLDFGRCFVPSNMPLPLTTGVRIELSAPMPPSSIVLFGVVVHCTPQSTSMNPGMSIAYNLSYQQCLMLQSLLKRTGLTHL